MNTAAEPVETPLTEPDLIDRIASALPEEIRAEYYRELLYCRSLPESDEMLRLLRAMQFLVLLIEQAPSRVAEERERLDKLLATTISNMTKISAASETYHAALKRRLDALPADIAYGFHPEAVARQINESLQREFIRSTIPKTGEILGGVADQMKDVCSEFSTTADSLSNTYRGAATEAQKAIVSLKSEITEAAESAARFTSNVALKFSTVYRLMLVMVTGGALVIGLAMGMMFERWLLSPVKTVAEAADPVVQTAAAPVQGTAEVDKARGTVAKTAQSPVSPKN